MTRRRCLPGNGRSTCNERHSDATRAAHQKKTCPGPHFPRTVTRRQQGAWEHPGRGRGLCTRGHQCQNGQATRITARKTTPAGARRRGSCTHAKASAFSGHAAGAGRGQTLLILVYSALYVCMYRVGRTTGDLVFDTFLMCGCFQRNGIRSYVSIRICP